MLKSLEVVFVSILFKDAEMNTESRVLCLSPFCGLFGLCM